MVTPLWHPSPNFGPRRNGARPDLVVLHYTAMDSAEAALERLCDPQAEVSAHYLISADGHVWQMVDENARAWHAGVGAWGAVEDVNSHSIGIELDNLGDRPFSDPLMRALETLLAGVLDRWSIPPERVIGHSDMAPGRKHDPGPHFDWHRLAQKGLSIWPASDCAASETPFEPLAARFGYPIGCDPDARLTAFRDRFRPGATGPEDAIDRALIADLAARWPVAPQGESA